MIDKICDFELLVRTMDIVMGTHRVSLDNTHHVYVYVQVDGLEVNVTCKTQVIFEIRIH